MGCEPRAFFCELGGWGSYKKVTLRFCQTMTLLSLYKHDPNLGVVGGQAKHFELFQLLQVP